MWPLRITGRKRAGVVFFSTAVIYKEEPGGEFMGNYLD